jgi:4'-phosphopantetheinyl transferase
MNCTDFQSNSLMWQRKHWANRGSALVRPEMNVFFAETKEPGLNYEELIRYISAEERIRAEKFRFDDDRNTFIASHAILRLILSKKLGINPRDILFDKDANTKPVLHNSELGFNVTHTRDAFALAVSDSGYVGIDIEEVNRKVDFKSIIDSHFSRREQDFITEKENETAERFFLLWTRKEALLKAFGVGVTTDLKSFNVYNGEDINRVRSSDSLNYSIRCENHFIYSKQIADYFLSIAVPVKSKIVLHKLNSEAIKSYLNYSEARTITDEA